MYILEYTSCKKKKGVQNAIIYMSVISTRHRSFMHYYVTAAYAQSDEWAEASIGGGGGGGAAAPMKILEGQTYHFAPPPHNFDNLKN